MNRNSNINDVEIRKGLKLYRINKILSRYLVPIMLIVIAAIILVYTPAVFNNGLSNWTKQAVVIKVIQIASWLMVYLIICLIVVVSFFAGSIYDVIISQRLYNDQPVKKLHDADATLSKLQLRHLRTSQQRGVKLLGGYVKDLNSYLDDISVYDTIMTSQIEADEVLKSVTSVWGDKREQDNGEAEI